jgi:hypothetical protein
MTRALLYLWLCARLPRPVVDLGYVLVRALLIIAVILLADAPFSTFTYFRR